MTGVPEVAALLERLDGVDHVDLPTLTREELLSLGDLPAFGDADDLAWWGGLSSETRDEVAAGAQRGLLGRRLIGPDADPTRVRVDPDLQVTLAIRSAPAFLTVVGVPGRPTPSVRALGVLDEHGAVSAVLLERRPVAGVCDFVLASESYAAMAVTRFLFEPPTADDPDARPVDSPLQRVLLRRVETFAAGDPTGVRHLAYAGVTAGALAPIDARGHAGVPVPVTEASMIDTVRAEWRGVAQRVLTAQSPAP